MAEIGSAFLSILPSAKGFSGKLEKDVGSGLGGSAKRLGSSFGKVFALGAGIVAAAGIGKFLGSSLDEAREAQKVGAQTANVIKSMGLAGKVTSGQIGDFATSLSTATGVDDELIQSSENTLLTFGNLAKSAGVTGGAFQTAAGLALDMSTALGTDLQGASIQIGKALNDPIKGVTALGKAGVSFTDQQKEQIKTLVASGDVTKAQSIVLGELSKEFKGSAAATATFGDKAKVTFGNIEEQIGTALLPAVDGLGKAFVKAGPKITAIIAGIGPAASRVGAFIAPLVSQLAGTLPGAFRAAVSVITTSVIPAFQNIGVLVLPLVTQLAGVFTGQLLPALTSVGTFLTGVVGPAFVSVTAFLAQHSVTVRAVAVAILAGVAAYKIYQFTLIAVGLATRAYAAVQAVLNAVLTANPIGLVILALVALAAGLVYAYKNSDKFRAVVDRTFKAIKKVVTTVINFVVPFVKNHWQLLLAIIGGPLGIIVGLVIKNFGKIKAFISATVSAVVATAHKFSQFATVVGENVGKAIKFFKELPGKIKGFLTGLPGELKTIGGNIIDGLKNGIKAAGQRVLDAVQNIIDKIPKFIRKRFDMHSPSKVTAKLGANISDGLAVGISSRATNVATAMRTTTAAAGKAVETEAEKAADKAKAAAKKLVDGVRDTLKDRISGLRDEFASLSDSVSSAFTGNLFEATNAGDFIKNLLGTQGQLQSLKAAFKTLLGYGLQPGFLSQLFASGNAGLILDLAAQDQATATQAGALFGNVTDLSSQLGNNVAQADVGPKLDKQIDLLQQLVGLQGGAAVALAKEINGAATGGKKKGHKGSGGKGKK